MFTTDGVAHRSLQKYALDFYHKKVTKRNISYANPAIKITLMQSISNSKISGMIFTVFDLTIIVNFNVKGFIKMQTHYISEFRVNFAVCCLFVPITLITVL